MRVLIVTAVLLTSVSARGVDGDWNKRAHDREKVMESGLIALLGGPSAGATAPAGVGIGTGLNNALGEIPKYQASDTPAQAEKRRAAAEKRFQEAEPKFKAYEAMEFTSPYTMRATLARIVQAKDDAGRAYLQVVLEGDAGWAVAAMARLAMLEEGIEEKLEKYRRMTAPLENTAGEYVAVGEPLCSLAYEAPSVTGWMVVLERAQEFHVENEWTALARTRLAALRAARAAQIPERPQ